MVLWQPFGSLWAPLGRRWFHLAFLLRPLLVEFGLLFAPFGHFGSILRRLKMCFSLVGRVCQYLAVTGGTLVFFVNDFDWKSNNNYLFNNVESYFKTKVRNINYVSNNVENLKNNEDNFEIMAALGYYGELKLQNKNNKIIEALITINKLAFVKDKSIPDIFISGPIL